VKDEQYKTLIKLLYTLVLLTCMGKPDHRTEEVLHDLRHDLKKYL